MRRNIWRLFSWTLVMLGFPLLAWVGYSTTADTLALSKYGVVKEAQVLAYERISSGPKTPTSYAPGEGHENAHSCSGFSIACPSFHSCD